MSIHCYSVSGPDCIFDSQSSCRKREDFILNEEGGRDEKGGRTWGVSSPESYVVGRALVLLLSVYGSYHIRPSILYSGTTVV